MFKKRKKDIKYKKDNVIVRHASLSEEYEVGGWITSYSWIRMGYELDSYNPKYSDVIYVMTLNREIIGYINVFTEVNSDKNNILPLYRKELIISDFVVAVKAYAKYAKILIDFILKYAAYNGYFVVSIRKLEEYKLFNEFIKRHYNVNESSDKFYFVIEKPRISSYQKHLIVYEKDNIELENLYFLYDLDFEVLKTKCTLKLNDSEKIIVDRNTGLIEFPSKIKLKNDRVILNHYTRSLIYLIISSYQENNVDNITINYDVNNPTYFEMDINGLLYVSKDINEIRDNNEYINLLINKGYDRVVPDFLRYDMNESCFSDGRGIYKLK